MSSDPLVSIVIPCFNAESTVSDAIRSALSQDYKNKEIVVIDDGSTDQSLSEIKSFGDRIRWETGQNRGGCAARNHGMEIARGEIIQFLDADDLLMPDKLSIQVPMLLSSSADIVFCNWKTVSGEEENTSALRFDHRTQDPLIFLLRYNIQTSTPLHWRRNLVSVGGFRVGLPCSQERDLHLRLAASGFSMRQTPQVLVEVRRFPQSVSSNYIRVLDQHADVFGNSLRILVDRDEATAKRVLAFAKAFALDARNYFKMGEKSRGWSYLGVCFDVIGQHKSLGFVFLSKLAGMVLRLVAALSGNRLPR